MADEKDPNQAPPPNELLTPAEPPEAQPGEVVGPQQYAGEDELPPAPAEHDDAMDTARDGMPGFEPTPNDPVTTAQGIGGVVTEAATKIPVKDGSVTPPQPSAEQMAKWDEQRAQNQQEWEQVAEIRNDSRPTKGIINKHKVGYEHTPMNVAHEEALRADREIDWRLRHGREKKYDPNVSYDKQEPITTRQDLVNESEAVKDIHSTFRQKKDYQIWSENRNWTKDQERLDAKMAPLIQEISIALTNGDFEAATKNYRPYTYELMDYIERKVNKQLSELASRLIAEGNPTKLAELLDTPFGLMLMRENLQVSEEQLRAPEIVKVVADRAAEFIRNTYDYDDPERAEGAGFIFRLESRLKALSNIGAMNLGDILESPQARSAAVDAIMDRSYVLYDREQPKSIDDSWLVEQFTKIGLSSPGEVLDSQQYKEAVKREVLGHISSANSNADRYDREPSVQKFKSFLSKIGRWGVGAEELASWPDAKPAVEKFFVSATEEMVGIRENWGIEYSERAFSGYLEKLKTLEEAGLVTKEEILTHGDFVKEMQASLEAIKKAAEAKKQASLEQSRILRKNADKPVREYEQMAEAGRELGLAA